MQGIANGMAIASVLRSSSEFDIPASGREETRANLTPTRKRVDLLSDNSQPTPTFTALRSFRRRSNASRLIDSFATGHGSHDSNVLDLRLVNRVRIVGEDDEICKLACRIRRRAICCEPSMNILGSEMPLMPVRA